MDLTQSPVFWSALSAVAAIIAATATASGLLLVYLQPRSARRVFSYQAWRDAHARITSTDARQDRKYCYSRLPENPGEASETEWAIAERVLDAVNEVAFQIRQGFLSESPVLDAHCNVFVKTWLALGPYVIKYRDFPGRSPNAYKDFEWIAGRATSYAALRDSGRLPVLHRNDGERVTPASPAP